MDNISLSLKDAALLREMASREEIPYGTDSAALFETLKDYIIDFEESLDIEHEVGMMLTNFGQSILMHISEVSFEEPALMVFKGYVDGQLATLIQHVNQLNFLLTSVPKEPDRPKQKIGFATE